MIAACRPPAASGPPTADEEVMAPTSATQVTWSAAPTFAWMAQDGARRYDVEMALDPEFSGMVLRDTTPVPRYVPSNGLAPGTYFWRTRVTGKADWTSTASLTVREPASVVEVPEGADAGTIRALADEAARQAPAILRFPERGQFRVDAPAVLLTFEGVQGLVVDGRGSTITFTSPMSGLAKMKDCREITFRDLVINHDPPPFTVGRITSVDHATGDLEIAVEPGHPDLDAPHILEDWGFCMFLEQEGRGRILDDSPLVPSLNKDTLRRTAAGFAIRAASPATVEVVQPGDRVVQFARKNNAQSLFHAERSSDLAFLRIINHSISGGHYLLLECDAARILNCHSLPAPGRTYGGNADGAHVRSSIVGPWIEGCSFEAVGDDGVALFAKGIEVKGHPAPDRVLLDKTFFNLREGQSFLFFNPREGTPIADPVQVRSIQKHAEGFLVEFEPPLAADLVSSFADPWNNDQAFNMSARHGGFVVRRNAFRDIRRYGVIARAESGAIEDNFFEGVSDSAITLQNEPNVWRNGLHSETVSIKGNRIRNCNFSRHARSRGAIHVVLRAIADVNQRWGDKATSWRGHRDLVVVGNEIAGWRDCAIFLGNIEGAVVEGNRIYGQRPSSPDAPAPCAILLRNVAGGAVTGNVFEGLLPGTQKEILRDSGQEDRTVVGFLSDNGAPPKNGSRNAPLRGGKGSTWEGGIREPFVMQWKGRIPAGQVVDAPVISLGLPRTALAGSGAEVPDDSPLDGVKPLRVLTGQAQQPPREALSWRYGPQMAVRTSDWKLTQAVDRKERPPALKTGLYKVVEDAGEQNDLAAAHPEKVQELQKLWDDWNKANVEPLWGDKQSR